MSYQFLKPGRYNVRLTTTSPTGQQDQDSIVVVIQNHDPIGQFTATFTNQETPNIVSLDATKSYDPDTLSSDGLTFVWYIDGQRTVLNQSSRNGALGTYKFTTLGSHKIRLDVISPNGRTSTTTNDVEIKSLLSVWLTINPKIARVGDNVAFIAQADNTSVYEWDFGDNTTQTTYNGRINHAFKTAGTQKITLTIRGINTEDTNRISRQVSIVPTDQPFAAMTLKKDNNEIFPADNACEGNNGYTADRVSAITFDASSSINADGSNNNLSYVWTYDKNVSSQENFSYRFQEIGCHPVTLTVTSKTTGQTSTSTTYISVKNAPPALSSINITADTTTDPVVVSLMAQNAKDPDGVITSYLWYYYTDNDPEPQDYRITLVPRTSFVLPKISGTYYFAVIMQDNNGDKTNTDDDKSQKYSITISSDNINMPLISLAATKTAVFVGDKIDFKATVKNILGKDISDKAEYKWDFDGDGFYDSTTSTPNTTYAYTKPGNFNMKVKVTYKGISNTKYINVVVKNVLKPDMLPIAFGDHLVIFNTSQGSYSQVTWDGGTKVQGNNPYYMIARGLSATDWPVKVSMTVSDGTDTRDVFRIIPKNEVNQIYVQKTNKSLIAYTYPKMAADGTITLDNAEQPIFVYLGESKGTIGRYAIDTDTSVDSDLNGTPDDDADNQ